MDRGSASSFMGRMLSISNRVTHYSLFFFLFFLFCCLLIILSHFCSYPPSLSLASIPLYFPLYRINIYNCQYLHLVKTKIRLWAEMTDRIIPAPLFVSYHHIPYSSIAMTLHPSPTFLKLFFITFKIVILKDLVSKHYSMGKSLFLWTEEERK